MYVIFIQVYPSWHTQQIIKATAFGEYRNPIIIEYFVNDCLWKHCFASRSPYLVAAFPIF